MPPAPKPSQVKTKVIQSVSQLKRSIQRVVNSAVRQRDKDLPCISCGKFIESGDAGHFVAQGSSGFLRYHPWNLNKQCTSCNRWKHGNSLEYRIGLVKKIGEANVKWLEDHRHDTKKWTREELQAIKLQPILTVSQ